MDQATTSVSSPRNGDETGLEQLSSDLQALKRLYGLLHKGPANENLDETSRALLMKMLDDATQQTLLKQAKILSGSLMSPALERKLSIRSDRQTRDAEPPMSLRPPALPSTPGLLAGERPSRLNPQYSTVSSRAVGNVHGSPLATEEPVLARLASYRSSRTTASALPPRHRPSGEQWNSGLSLYRLPVAATSRHGTVTGGARNADHRDTTRRTSGRGDQTSLETSSSRGSERARPGVAATLRHGTVAGDTTRRTSGRGDQSSPEGSISSHSRRSMSPEVSLGRTGLRDRGTVRHVGAEGFSSVRRLRRLDSGLSLGMVSCRGSERAGRGVAATSQHGTVIGSNRQAEQRDRTRRTSGRSDQSSPKGSSRRRSVSREMSLGRKRLQGRGTDRRVGAESSSTRRLGRLDSRLSLGMVSRCGSERAGRGVAATSQHGTVIGRNRHADQRDRTRRTSGRGHQSSTEGSSRRRSVSRGASLGQAQLHGRATVQHVGAESSSSMRPLRRQDSGLTLGKASCCGLERAGRGVATPEQSSSSNTMVTIHSRIRPNRDPKGRLLRRAEDDDEESTPWRRSTNASASSAGLSRRKPRRTLKRVDSGSMYISSHNSLSGAAISYHSTSPTVLPESSASASYSPPPVSRPGTVPPVSWQGIALPMPWRGIAPPMYAPQVSRSMRRRRRQEVLAKRVERLRMLKNKIATVFHHHYHNGRDEEGPSSSRTPGEQHHMSPLKYLGGMFHRTKGQDKKSTSRAVVSAPGKRPGGGGGNMQALFDEMRRHLRAKRRAPTSVNLWRKIANRSRVHAKKMHLWQRLKPRRGRAGVLAGSKLRRRLGR
ncbi:hypothetical protein PAHAL_7G278600 [Panicum hallii]|uniref:Uncharacterized protein n=1 Tax=Panicum hallii TaxID=206008 RepID=A0A2S3IA20_9POAL|nr:hypothetical protein PAHAL_7G278600 [Panicum hallii]